MKFSESQGATASARWFISLPTQVGFRIWGLQSGRFSCWESPKKDDQNAGVCNEGDR